MPLPPATEPRASRRRHAAWRTALVLAIAAMIAIIAVRIAGRDPVAASGLAAPALAVRTFGDLRLPIPAGWTVLDRSGDRLTWGSPDRSHAVTLSATEASVLPLVSIVRGVAREGARQLPGARVVDGPTLVEPDGALPRSDAYVLVRLRIDRADGARPLDVVQAWRRDSRAGVDIVATWTSSDGSWPADPRTAIPSSAGGA